MSDFLGRLFAMLAVWRLIKRHPTGEHEPPEVEEIREQLEDVSERTVPRNPGAERLVAGLLVVAALCGFGFTALYVLRGHNNQLLGLAVGGLFGFMAVAAIIAGKFVVPQETTSEEREPLLEEGQPEEIVELVESGGEGVSRRGLLLGATGVAAAGMTTAVATTVASLGPRLTDIHRTPWHRGVPFVDEQGKQFHADEIEVGSFYTALPAGYYWEQLGAPLLVVKLPAHYIHLPPSRKHWAPEGILAYSKICPHAACAISLYRYPTFAPTSPAEPAFTCPCHYSTFLPGEGGKLLFGPAGRPLPQLPVMIDSKGFLLAGGGFDEDVGPSWFDVHYPKHV